MRKTRLRKYADPEFAARHRARMRELHADPEFDAKWRAKWHEIKQRSCAICGKAWSPSNPIVENCGVYYCANLYTCGATE